MHTNIGATGKVETYSSLCPECEWAFEIEGPQVGEVVVCPDCNLNLLVITVDATTHKASLKLTEATTDDWGQ